MHSGEHSLLHLVPKWHPEAVERVGSVMRTVKAMEVDSRIQLWESTMKPDSTILGRVHG